MRGGEAHRGRSRRQVSVGDDLRQRCPEPLYEQVGASRYLEQATRSRQCEPDPVSGEFQDAPEREGRVAHHAPHGLEAQQQRGPDQRPAEEDASDAQRRHSEPVRALAVLDRGPRQALQVTVVGEKPGWLSNGRPTRRAKVMFALRNRSNRDARLAVPQVEALVTLVQDLMEICSWSNMAKRRPSP